jgi:ribonuclease HII
MTAKHIASPFPTLEFEENLWKGGFTRIAGVDEAGRGAWAGPVVAAAVLLPEDPSLTRTLSQVRDSKLMTPLARSAWAPRIKAAALGWGVGLASAAEIDRLGILPATKLAATRALRALSPASIFPDYLLTDYLVFPEIDLPQSALVKGDQRSLSVAAASVLAKTARDAMLVRLDNRHPGYGFSRHKGYGTAFHRQALLELGRCAEHRNSFSIPGKTNR